MGRLEPACFAPGTDNTLYALVFAHDLSVAKGADNGVVVLIKSNSSPSGPDALTWQVVSTIREAELASFVQQGIFGHYPIQCLVDPNGGFLAWSYQTYQPGPFRDKRPRPGGFRYDPLSTTPSATTTGKGGWVNVDSPITYSWSSPTYGGGLMVLADGAGKYNYYHAYISSSMNTAVNFGALNTAVTPNLMEDSATKWTLNVK